MLATNQQQLLGDADQIFDWQVQQAQSAIDALEETRGIADTRYNHYNDLTKPENFANVAEGTSMGLQLTGLADYSAAAGGGEGVAAVTHALPYWPGGRDRIGGSPAAHAGEGGTNAGNSAAHGANVIKALAGIPDKSSKMANTIGSWHAPSDDNAEKATEARLGSQQARTSSSRARSSRSRSRNRTRPTIRRRKTSSSSRSTS